MAEKVANLVRASICPVKDNRTSIVTIISDDGDLQTSYFLSRLAAEYQVNITIAPTIERIQKNVTHWLYIEKIFPIDIVNHSWTHPHFADSNISIDELRRQIIGASAFLGKYFKSPNFCFVPPFNELTDDSYDILYHANFLAARRGQSGINSLSPQPGTEPGQWYNLKCRGIGDNDFDIDDDLSNLAAHPGWLIEMWHNIYTDIESGYQPVNFEKAKEHIGKINAANHIWFASFNEAVSYIYQRDNVSLHSFFHDGILHLKLRARNPLLPWEKFNTCLSILVNKESLPVGTWKIIDGVESFSIQENGDLIVNIYPEKHGQLKCE